MARTFKTLVLLVLIVLAVVGVIAIGTGVAGYISYCAQPAINQTILKGMFEYISGTLFSFLG